MLDNDYTIHVSNISNNMNKIYSEEELKYLESQKQDFEIVPSKIIDKDAYVKLNLSRIVNSAIYNSATDNIEVKMTNGDAVNIPASELSDENI